MNEFAKKKKKNLGSICLAIIVKEISNQNFSFLFIVIFIYLHIFI